MTLTDFYNEVSRRSDTGKQEINVSETKRVIAVAFATLADMEAADAMDVIAKGLSTAAKKKAK